MAAIASVSQWNPEDDLLLKNAVEAGASLEALAKGAVRFSRKFTVRELRDRWRSLLYDPDVSAEASARMVEHELSFTGNAPTVLRRRSVIEAPPGKRKAESVREMYSAMRKRLSSNQVFQPFDLGFLHEDDRISDGGDCQKRVKFGYDEPLSMIGDHIEDRSGFRSVVSANAIVNNESEFVFERKDTNTNPTLGDNIVDEFGNSSDAEDIGPSDMPIWKTIEDVSAPAMPISMSVGDKDQPEAETLMLPEDDDSEPILKVGDFVDLSDCLLNLANEDGILLVDEDGKDAVNNSLNSILLSPFSSNVHDDNDVPNVCEPQRLVLNTGLDVDDDRSQSGRGDQHGACSSEVDMAMSISVPEEERDCTLNTESTEIPCNDNICLPISSAFSPMPSSSTHQRNGEQGMSLKKKGENPTQSFTRMVGLDTVPESSPKHPIVGFGVKPRSSGGNGLAVGSKEITVVHVDPSQARSVSATPKSAIDGALKIEETSAPATVREHAMLHAQQGSTFLEAEANTPTVELEESDSDCDIPCFFDIEAMILEMDLCPDDQDSYISREVSRYQHEGTKRRIIRLEQCSRSSMQRAIASQGALAILYGRHLKQYIKKTEVILGRATIDSEVDINLGEEGRANKVSRRQALIKMEQDGSFFLKNLGKSSIFLNGKEVARGQRLSLNSGSLIEIREMAFVFEMNHKSVRRYLANAAKKTQDENTIFEWSPEGAHE
ncbi:uncharacterized protein LOC132171924 isoform X1 [Corylus avellana]|uniref:uncharacterized protein LOC132171924 isoform X1 n=1 Tax=Corylus avellana TaxID=13451 RepID=UPI001E1F6510|nr:uncharacterized protein LOC132171924 isoform X1 [Corylus avellana]